MLNWLRKAIVTTLARVRDWFRGSLLRPAPPGSVPHEPGSLRPGYEHRPLPPAPPPKIIPYDPTYVAAGPNLVKNGIFDGNVGAGTEILVNWQDPDPGVIQDWRVTGGTARWIGIGHPVFNNTHRLVDLTGGIPPSPFRVLATLRQDAPLGLQAGKSYEVAVDLGVGPNNGPSENFGPPVVVSISVIEPPGAVEWQFIGNPLNPPVGTGIKWETHKFRFAIPAGYPLSPTNQTITITGNYGNRFIGVDNVSVRLLT